MEKNEEVVSSTLRTYKAKDAKPIVWNVKSVPEQRLRDKLAKNRLWTVNESRLNLDGKKFEFSIVDGPNSVAKREITFEDACKDFGWKSFTLTENKQTIIPEFTIED